MNFIQKSRGAVSLVLTISLLASTPILSADTTPKPEPVKTSFVATLTAYMNTAWNKTKESWGCAKNGVYNFFTKEEIEKQSFMSKLFKKAPKKSKKIDIQKVAITGTAATVLVGILVYLLRRHIWNGMRRFGGGVGGAATAVGRFFARFPAHVRATPGKLKDGAIWVWDGVKATPGKLKDGAIWVKDGIKATPRKIKDGTVWAWNGVKATPGKIKDGIFYAGEETAVLCGAVKIAFQDAINYARDLKVRSRFARTTNDGILDFDDESEEEGEVAQDFEDFQPRERAASSAISADRIVRDNGGLAKIKLKLKEEGLDVGEAKTQPAEAPAQDRPITLVTETE